jgi:hypothetical protein
VHRGSSAWHGAAKEASSLMHLQVLVRRLLVHSSASESAPGASKNDQPGSTTHPNSSSFGASSSTADIKPVVPPAPFVPSSLISSNTSSTPAADSIHSPQSIRDAAAGASVSQAPSEPSAAAGGVQSAAEVWHPCLHEGFAAKYDRLAYDGTAPNPAQVRGMGTMWELLCDRS